MSRSALPASIKCPCTKVRCSLRTPEPPTLAVTSQCRVTIVSPRADSLSLFLSLCFFSLFLRIEMGENFKTLFARLASLELATNPPGQSFLFVPVCPSTLYFRELICRLWGPGGVDLCLRLARLNCPIGHNSCCICAGFSVWTSFSPDWRWLRHLNPGSDPLGTGFCFLRHCLLCHNPRDRFNLEFTGLVWSWNWAITNFDGKERALYFLLKDYQGIFRSNLQGLAMWALLDQILIEIWADDRRWEGYRLARRYRACPRIQSSDCFAKWLWLRIIRQKSSRGARGGRGRGRRCPH